MDTSVTPSDQGKMWAAASYGALIFGLPLGLVPLLLRDDRFALYHAKNATAVFLLTLVGVTVLSIVISVIAAVTCGVGALLYVLVFVPWLWMVVVGVHGLILSLNGQMQEPIGVFGLGEKVFGSIKPKDALPGD